MMFVCHARDSMCVLLYNRETVSGYLWQTKQKIAAVPYSIVYPQGTTGRMLKSSIEY